jgi:hypothetical protein
VGYSYTNILLILAKASYFILSKIDKFDIIFYYCLIRTVCGYGLMVEFILAMDTTGVRFPVSAPAYKDNPSGYYFFDFIFTIK